LSCRAQAVHPSLRSGRRSGMSERGPHLETPRFVGAKKKGARATTGELCHIGKTIIKEKRDEKVGGLLG